MHGGCHLEEKSVSLTARQARAIELLAKANGNSESAEIRSAVVEHLAKQAIEASYHRIVQDRKRGVV